MTEKSRQNLNVLRTKRAFEAKRKAFFIIFKGLSIVKKCLSPESALLTDLNTCHVFHVNIIAHCPQNRYVRFAM